MGNVTQAGCRELDSGTDTEDLRYLRDQLITYIGNKRALLQFIGSAVETVRSRLGVEKLDVVDPFSGSGIVARFLKSRASRLVVNDLEPYCEVINRCYLANRDELDLPLVRSAHRELLERLDVRSLRPGIISKHYAPLDDENIGPGERVFYTRRNAMYLDTARMLIDEFPAEMQPFLLAPLLSEASVHANTAGVFKGFYKDAATGIGKFGGSNADALDRIKGDISLPFPVFSRHACRVEIHTSDANDLVEGLGEVDLAYLDPPYNQHPYGSNYFMLNLLVDYQEPAQVSTVSGIPVNWLRSSYNKSARSLRVFQELVHRLKAKYLLVSFNSEGFIDRETMVRMLSEVGRVQVQETTYNAFRGSRNLRSRPIHVREYLYLVEKR